MRAFAWLAVSAALLAGTADAAGVRVLEGDTCGFTVAPWTWRCVTGIHAAAMPVFVETIFETFRGGIEHRFTLAAGAAPVVVTWRCEFGADWKPPVCEDDSKWMQAVPPYHHECWTYDHGTDVIGGSGEWSCDLVEVVGVDV